MEDGEGIESTILFTRCLCIISFKKYPTDAPVPMFVRIVPLFLIVVVPPACNVGVQVGSRGVEGSRGNRSE